MKIKRKRIAKFDIMSHLLLATMVESFVDIEERDKFFKEIDYANKEEIEVCLTFEGKEFNIEKVCEDWSKQIDRMVNKKALDLIEDRFHEHTNIAHSIIDDLTSQLIRRAKEDLNIELN